MVELVEYLRRYDMEDALSEVLKIARTELPDAELEVALWQDPEENDEHVVIYARFPEYGGSELRRIRKAREKIRRVLYGRKGFVFLTTDFEPRRRKHEKSDL